MTFRGQSAGLELTSCMALRHWGMLFITSGLCACDAKVTTDNQPSDAGLATGGNRGQGGAAGHTQIVATGGTSGSSLSGLGGAPGSSGGSAALGGSSATMGNSGGTWSSGGVAATATGGTLSSTGGTQASHTGGTLSSTGGTQTAHTGGTTAHAGGSSSTGGTATTGGGQASGGAGGNSSAITGGARATGGAGATGGNRVKTDATDTIGQNPFKRAPEDGILITSSDGLNTNALVIAADNHDGLLIAGATENPAAMGLTAFDPGIVSEAFAAKLDAQGHLVWSVPLKPCGVPSRIAAGPDDSAFVLCPNEPDVTTLMSFTCDATALVTKLAANDGHVLFQTAVAPDSAPTSAYWCPYALAVNAQGNSYVGGGYAQTFPNEQALVIGLSADGKQQWSFVSSGPSDSDPNADATAYTQALAVDSNGRVLACGSFNNWVGLGNTKLTSQASDGQWSMYNGFVGSWSANGTGASGWLFGGAVFDLGEAIKPASAGGYYIGGMLSSTAKVGGKTTTASAEGAAFISLIDATGNAAWVKNVATKSIARDLAADASGKVYFVGSFADSELYYVYDPAADTLKSVSTVSGTADANSLITQSVAVTTSGSVWIAGNFSGTIDLGTGKLSTNTVTAFLWKVN